MRRKPPQPPEIAEEEVHNAVTQFRLTTESDRTVKFTLGDTTRPRPDPEQNQPWRKSTISTRVQDG
jgi:hypothetical protein